MVSREYDGLAGAGGVKDVCRQLAESLAGKGGCRVRVVLPRYGFMDAQSLGFAPLRLPGFPCVDTETQGLIDTLSLDMNYPGENRLERVAIWQAVRHGVSVYLVEAERFAEKLSVYTYTAEEERVRSWQRHGAGHIDYFAMNILLQKAALALMMALGERPEVIHCQDGHTAVLPALIREMEGYRQYFRQTGAVVTIHNAGIGYHQEVADLPFARAITGLSAQVVNDALLGTTFDPFLAAAPYAVLNTVSEQYARELQESDEDARTGWLGHQLRLRGVTLAGVTNGINPADFNTSRGKALLGLAASYDVNKGHFAGKRECKESLLHILGTRDNKGRVSQAGQLAMHPDQPLITFIGRLTAQKGVDILLGSCEVLLREDSEFQLVVLGGGDPELESQLTALAETEEFGDRVCFLGGYDQDLAMKIYAAGDFFLIPSLYEPCGLTDYIAQLLGNLPIVHHVGGLVKVLDGRTGFSYREHSPGALADCVRRALSLYRTDPAGIRSMQQQAVRHVREQYSWDRVKDRYLAIYDQSVRMACSALVREVLA
ncbi:MAG TPA: glycogen synthase [Desulfobulbaceae bacterium]|nr:glycogen synthase [Desulfobulbaceae bacterium]